MRILSGAILALLLAAVSPAAADPIQPGEVLIADETEVEVTPAAARSTEVVEIDGVKHEQAILFQTPEADRAALISGPRARSRGSRRTRCRRSRSSTSETPR